MHCAYRVFAASQLCVFAASRLAKFCLLTSHAGAAERFPDKCDKDPEGTKALNVAASSDLAAACAAHNALLIYVSTDYVFPGKPGEAPYAATASTSPPNFYGETKLGGEQAVLSAPGTKSVVLRVPVLYGEVETPSESAVNTLLDAVWNKAGKERVEMDHWSIRYPTNTSDVARVLKDVAEKYSAGDFEKLPRVLQFSSEDRMTKYEICQTLAELAGLPLDHMVGNDKVDPNAAVQRPYDCHLDTKELKDLGIDVSTVPFKDWWYITSSSCGQRPCLTDTQAKVYGGIQEVNTQGEWINKCITSVCAYYPPPHA